MTFVQFRSGADLLRVTSHSSEPGDNHLVIHFRGVDYNSKIIDSGSVFGVELTNGAFLIYSGKKLYFKAECYEECYISFDYDIVDAKIIGQHLLCFTELNAHKIALDGSSIERYEFDEVIARVLDLESDRLSVEMMNGETLDFSFKGVF